MDTQTPGARASIELQLQDARRDLDALIEEKNGYLQQADVCSALACDPGARAVAQNTRAANLRLSAFALGGDIHKAKLNVARLESMLKSEPAAAPVVLTAEQVAAADEMAFCGVAL